MAQAEFAPGSIFDPQVKEVPVEQVKEGEGYVGLLVRVSLQLVSKDLPLEVQRHGAKMLQHLLKFRCEELSSADLNLTVELVRSRDENQDNFADIIHPRMLRVYGKADRSQAKGCLLLAEHNNLCQAFVIDFLRNPVHMDVLHSILNLLNIIWNKSDWENTFLRNDFGLSCLLDGNYFLKTVRNMVKLCEGELKTTIEGRSHHTNFVYLLCLILPLLLQLLWCIHSLWKDQIACNLFEELERAKSPMNEGFETADLLEEIRDRGYNVLGLCISLKGAFDELLDSSCFIIAFVDFDSMEFRHLRKVILAVFAPLVKHCPNEFYKEWMVDLLIPFL